MIALAVLVCDISLLIQVLGCVDYEDSIVFGVDVVVNKMLLEIDIGGGRSYDFQ